MATSARPFLMTGAALASVAAIATAAPATLPGVPSPLKLSTAQYNLTSISDITAAGISDAVTNGWGGFIGLTDKFYPGQFNNDVKVTGTAGAAYYVLDNALEGIAPFNLENYFFEVGSKGTDLVSTGLGAVAYVGAGSVLGLDSPVTQAVKSFVTGGATGGVDISSAILSLTASIPVVGDLTSIYFTGQKAGDTTVYGTGFAGVLAYAKTLLPNGLSNLDLTGVISAVTGFVSNFTGGGHGWAHGSSKHAEESDEADDDTEDNEGSEHQVHAGASVAARKSVPVVAAPVAAVTAVKPASAVAAKTGDDANEVKTETETPKASEVSEVTDSDGSATEAAPAAPATPAAPKLGAKRAQASQGAEKSAAAHGKKTKVSRGSH